MYGFSAYGEYAYSEIPASVVVATPDVGVPRYSGGIIDLLTARDRAREALRAALEPAEAPTKARPVPVVADERIDELRAALEAAERAYREWYVELLRIDALEAHAERLRLEADDEDALLLLMH